MRKLPCALAIVALLFAGSACKKSTKTEITDPKSLSTSARLTRSSSLTTRWFAPVPGRNFEPSRQFRRDAKVQVVGRDGDWLLIVSKRGNPPGYIEMTSVRPAPGKN